MYRQITAAFMIITISTSVGAETLLECSRIEDDVERVACYDGLAGRVEEKIEDSYEGTTEQRVEARNESVAEAVMGSDESVPDFLTLEIKDVIRGQTGRITYRTTDGRLFRRSSGSSVSFSVGDKCTLETGIMSAIFLVREDGKKNKVKELSSN